MGIISQTDIECVWKSKPGKRIYAEALPIREFCHVEAANRPFSLQPHEVAEIKSVLISLCKDSALAKHG